MQLTLKDPLVLRSKSLLHVSAHRSGQRLLSGLSCNGPTKYTNEETSVEMYAKLNLFHPRVSEVESSILDFFSIYMYICCLIQKLKKKQTNKNT